MLLRDKVAIWLTVLPLLFVIIGAFMMSNTNESVTAAAIYEKIKIGTISEDERISEDILLKSDIGEGTSSTTVTATTSQSTSTLISTQSSVETTGSSTIATTSVATTSTIIPPETLITFTPTAAVDTYGIEQISPMNGQTDGTVDLNDNEDRWLGTNGEYIQVDGWNSYIDGTPGITSAIVSCEVQYVNNKPGFVEFSYNSGAGWSSWQCSQAAIAGTTYTCDLKQYGLDTANEINNAKVRCKMRNNDPKGGAVGFSIDSIVMNVMTQ
mgnify:CR=1 FL=1